MTSSLAAAARRLAADAILERRTFEGQQELLGLLALKGEGPEKERALGDFARRHPDLFEEQVPPAEQVPVFDPREEPPEAEDAAEDAFVEHARRCALRRLQYVVDVLTSSSEARAKPRKYAGRLCNDGQGLEWGPAVPLRGNLERAGELLRDLPGR